MMQIHIFIDVEGLDYILSLFEKMAPAVLSLRYRDVRIGEKPKCLRLLVTLDVNRSQLLHEIEIDGQKQINEQFPDMLRIPDDEMRFLD
jgi:hypothetical protein